MISARFERTAVLVSTLVDENDIDHSFGDFSLREAIEFVNASLPDLSDAIRFDESIWGGTILLTQGQLNIEGGPATIEGPGADLMTIDASGNDPTPDTDNGDGSRVFQTGGEVEIIGVTLTGGDTPSLGGAISAGESDFGQSSDADSGVRSAVTRPALRAVAFTPASMSRSSTAQSPATQPATC